MPTGSRKALPSAESHGGIVTVRTRSRLAGLLTAGLIAAAIGAASLSGSAAPAHRADGSTVPAASVSPTSTPTPTPTTAITTDDTIWD